MPDDVLVEEPVRGLDAFERSDAAARLSRAAFLLALGGRVRQRMRAVWDGIVPGAFEPGAVAGADEETDCEVLGVPPLGEPPPLPPSRGAIQKRYSLEPGRTSTPMRLADLPERVMKTREVDAALALFECGLGEDDLLTRTASAIAYSSWLVVEPALIRTLVDAVQSGERLPASMALHALARIAPRHPALARVEQAEPLEATEPSNTSLMVHGTFARNEKWWQPAGSFHAYLLRHVPDLYGKPDRYEWSGGYSGEARSLAALRMGRWAADRSVTRFAKIVAHSHGGSVSMLATHGNVAADQLVLLSCPVHVDRYLPDMSMVRDVVSFQVHMDLVVLADLGRHKFSTPGIRDKVIPVWFDHGASHDAAVWEKYALYRRL